MSFQVYFPVTDEEVRRIVANDMAARNQPAKLRTDRSVRDSARDARALDDAAVFAQIGAFAGNRPAR